MRHDYDYIVLGLGGFGSGTAYWLSKRAGGDVLGLEQFELGHDRGASQDHSRIIRLSYHTPRYVNLAKRAYAAWAELERESDDQLILKTGGLDFGPYQGAIPLSNYADSMAAAGVPFERIDADEIMRRWPPFRIPESIQGLYQAESGIAMAARCNAAHVRMARDYGAVLRERMPVTDVRATDGEFEVIAAGSVFRSRKVIITAGPWSNPVLAHFDVRLPLTVTQEQVTYFASPQLDAFHPSRFPIWIWMDDPSYYGFPALGEAGTKVGQDAGGREVTADTRSFEVDEAALDRVQAFLRRYLPSALGPIIHTKTCLYTMTPDRDFVIDAVPGQPNALVAIGGGHGFKFASLIGRILAELAIEGVTACDLEPFRIDRPVLTLANPPKHFMV